MVSRFEFPGKGTRLIRCGSTVYKITVQSNGNPDRYTEDQLLCDEDCLQEELKTAVNTVIAMTRKSNVHLFRTDHLVVMPKRKPWKGSTLLNFKQHTKHLKAHPYMLVITIDSCQRYLQKEEQSNIRRMKRPADKDIFAEPAPKKKHLNEGVPQYHLSTPRQSSTISSKQSSVVSRNRTPLLSDPVVMKLIKEYATAQKQRLPQNISAENAHQVISNIAEQLRPKSACRTGFTLPHSIQRRTGIKFSTKKHITELSEKNEITDEESDSEKMLPPNQNEAKRQYYYLRKYAHNSREYDHMSDSSRRGNENHHSTLGGYPAQHLTSRRDNNRDSPRTRSMARSTESGDNSQSNPRGDSFFSKLLTPLKRLFH